MQDVLLELWAIGRVRGRMAVDVVGDRRSKGLHLCLTELFLVYLVLTFSEISFVTFCV